MSILPVPFDRRHAECPLTLSRYVLSPTHLHEYKSADKTQAPVMSLYLPEQKLGSHSTEGSSSNKFVLKGRQTGPMHRGHTWVFRAESHDTMMAWYDDIKTLTERSPEQREHLVRSISRSASRSSGRSSFESVGGDDEEPPFTATAASTGGQPKPDPFARRPSGGRFPSDVQVNAQRGLQVPVSPLSVSSGYDGNLNPGLGTVSPGADLGRQPQGAEYFARSRETEQNGIPHQTGINGLDDAAVRLQYPINPVNRAYVETQSVMVTRPVPQQRPNSGGLDAGNSSTNPRPHSSSTGVSGDGGPKWAEPVPIPVPIPRQPSSFGEGSAPEAVYRSQPTATVNDQGSGQGLRGGGRGEPEVNSAAVFEEQKSARPGGPGIEEGGLAMPHLHVPGEYPRGSNGG